MTTKKEKKLIRALEETLWMANRYSFGRLSYAPSMFKDAFDSIKDLLNPIEIKRIEEDKVIEEIKKDVEEERKELKEAGKAEAINELLKDINNGISWKQLEKELNAKMRELAK